VIIIFEIIGDDHTKCEEDISSGKFYYNHELNKYELYSNKLDNCEKCIMDFKNNNLICKECITNYALKYNDNVICIEKSGFDGDNTFFTNDSGKSYYSCSLFNNAKKCL